MVRTFLVIWFLFHLGQCLLAQSRAVTDLITDLKYLETVVQAGHPARLHHQISFESIYKDLKNRDSVTRFEYRHQIGRALQAIGCVHTSVLKNPLDKPNKKYFPLLLSEYQGKTYITNARDSTLIGKEVLAVNQVKTKQLSDELAVLYASDGQNEQAISRYIFSRSSSTLLAKYFEEPSEYTIQTSDSILIIAADTAIWTKQPLKNGFTPVITKGKCSLSVLENTALLKVSSFKSKDIKTYKKMIKKVASLPNINHLILDLRENGGGARQSAGALAAHFVPKTTVLDVVMPRKGRIFRHLSNYGKGMFVFSKIYYAKDIFKWHFKKEGLTVRNKFKPKKDQFRGQLYVLCDGATASSSTTCITFLKNQLPIQLIGTTTGGAINGNYGGVFPSIVLPKSKMKLRIPAYYLRFDKGEPPFVSATPDYIVEQNPMDTKAKKDSVIEFVLKNLIQK
jgi:Peptidase family S41